MIPSGTTISAQGRHICCDSYFLERNGIQLLVMADYDQQISKEEKVVKIKHFITPLADFSWRFVVFYSPTFSM